MTARNKTIALTLTLLLALLWFRGPEGALETPPSELQGTAELPSKSTSESITASEEVDSISWAQELGDAPFQPPSPAFERAQANYLESLDFKGTVDLPLQHIDESLSLAELQSYEEQRILAQRNAMIQELNEEPLELSDLDKEMASYLLREAGFTSVYDYEK